ncbi:MaLonyl CoA Decarboxylase [Trichostrongylus colubriformis]|uniref:MaLonyl CoA Decarboxylase n=1 Tax=Trichostrongylus colubriformis TaxID=6319 RepID=A0AAN8EYE4_TRICO
MRAHLLHLMKAERDKTIASSLHRLEESAHELLVLWFCQSNMKLERLTWQSPGDILHKVSEYEAVHPVRGPSDFMKRLGHGRRCFYFSHEAMPREPLVVVHVALLNEIADNVQSIVNCEHLDYEEQNCTTAIYYSITATQPGLTGIDLGNMLIKRVASLLQSELPSVQTHSTLSPIPGFRTWMLRRLHGSSLYGMLVDDTVLEKITEIVGRKVTKQEAADIFIEWLTNISESTSQLDDMKDVLLRLCASYLTSKRQNGFALNPVANFHLRNGAELYRLNWKGDTSERGLESSLGIMVNYRYRLEKVLENSVRYTLEKHIPVHDNVSSLL